MIVFSYNATLFIFDNNFHKMFYYKHYNTFFPTPERFNNKLSNFLSRVLSSTPIILHMVYLYDTSCVRSGK